MPALFAEASAILAYTNATVHGDGNAVFGVFGGNLILAACTFISDSDTAIRLFGGAQLNVVQADITALLHGIDCTGGGRVNVVQASAAPPIFAVGGNELVVGPGPLEQSTYAMALPGVGDSFSNAAASSIVCRD